MGKVSHLRLTAGGLALAATLSGCVVITSQTSQQLQTIGAVRLTTTACFSNKPGCPDKGNSGINASDGAFQVLLGYRVPEGVASPQQISTTAGQPLTFARDNTYAAELQRMAPTAKDQRWLGYRSGIVGSIASPSFTIGPVFALNQAPSGAPFDGPFAYRVVTGARDVGNDPNGPVNCGKNLAGDDQTDTICVDSPSLSELGADLLQPTQDLGILASGAPHQVSEGTVMRMPYRLLYSGKKSGAPNFNLRASTNVPGGTASVSPESIRPSGATKVRVLLRVPHNTEKGSYDVSLVATASNGQVRSRTHELQVGVSKRRCRKARPTILGTAKNDRISGTPRRDVIASLGGNDRVRSRGGNDLVCAGAGNDTVRGGGGDDKIDGLAGRDMLIGGQGGDTLIGGRGKDRFKH